jgi:hypothetical protein
MTKSQLEEAKRIQGAIREALLKEWDPIGVKGIAEAHDEYDGYVGQVSELLQKGATAQEVFAYLWWVETEHMGLPGNRQATEQFARRLVDLRAELTHTA